MKKWLSAAQNMVAEFHQAFGAPINERPVLWMDEDRSALRATLIAEEAKEVVQAIESDRIGDIAKELADLAYVVYGAAIEYGIDLDDVIAEVHHSNMSKLDADGKPFLRADGKVLKSNLYRPANVEAVLNIQRTWGTTLSEIMEWPARFVMGMNHAD